MWLFSAAGRSALFAFSVPSVFSVFSVSSVPSVPVGIPSVAGISSVIQTGSGALSIVQNIADEPDARVRKVADAVDKAAFARVFTANNIHRTIGISRKHLCIRKDGAGRGIQNDKLRNLAQSVDELCHFIGAEKLGGIVRSGIAVDYKKIIHRLADNVRKLRRAVKVFNQSGGFKSAEIADSCRLAHVAIDKHGAFAFLCKCNGGVQRNGGFTLAGNGACEQNDFVAVFLGGFLNPAADKLY